MDLYSLTITQAHELLRQRKISSLELTQAVLERIREVDGQIGAYLTVTEGVALEQARQADERLRRGERVTPLTGIPFGVKDSIVTEGIRTTCGSRILEHYVPPYQATAVRRLLEAGAVLLGKHNLDEFSMGSSTENSAFFPTRNPWDLKRVPGGSSGGSAAAVAGRQVPLALGTDSAGSVRMPASLCGIVGLKPTHGRVSLRGLVASMTVTTDHIGPMTRTVADTALLLETMAGYDPADPFSLDRPSSVYRAALGRSVRGVRVGVPRNYFFDLCDPEVAAGVRAAIGELARLGAGVHEVTIPDLEELMHLRAGLAGEALAFIDPHLRRHPEQISPALRARLYAAYLVSAGDYARANRVRRLLMERFAAVLREVDLLAAPATIVPAFPIDADTVPARDFRTGAAVELPWTTALVRNTAPANLTGLPSISVPAGFTRAGLPFGLLLTGRPFEEELLLAVAHAYEQATRWYLHAPPEA